MYQTHPHTFSIQEHGLGHAAKRKMEPLLDLGLCGRFIVCSEGAVYVHVHTAICDTHIFDAGLRFERDWMRVCAGVLKC